MVVVTYRTEDDLDLIDMIRIQSIWMEMTSLFRGLETIAAAAAEKVRIPSNYDAKEDKRKSSYVSANNTSDRLNNP